MTQLVRYDAMCRAIAEVHSIDEVKEIRDQARALEEYARQSQNYEAERQCAEIRIRAERKCGELLKETEKAKGTRGQLAGREPSGGRSTRPPEPSAKTLAEYGLTKDQSSKFQRLAAVPEDIFERELKTQPIPSAEAIIHAHAPRQEPPQRDERALWLWGRLQDFERDGLLALDPHDLFNMMSDHMQTTTKRLAPMVAAWLRRLEHD